MSNRAQQIARAKARRNTASPLPKATLALLALCLGFGLMYLMLGLHATMLPDKARENSIINAAGQPAGSDFIAFYAAGEQARGADPVEVYDSTKRAEIHQRIGGYVDGEVDEEGQKITRTYGFAYPPFVLPVLSGLSRLDYFPALALWSILPVLGLMGAAWGWFRIGWLPFVVLLHPTVLQNVLAGQNGALTATLLLGGLLALRNGKAVLAGLLFAAMAYKPHIVILLPLCLLAAREWKAFATMAACGLLLLAIPFALYGSNAAMAMWLEGWPKQVAETASYIEDPQFQWHRVFTFYVLGLKLGLPVVAAKIVQSLVALGLIGSLCYLWSRRVGFTWRALALVLAIPLITPYAFDYDMVALALFPALLLAGHILEAVRTPSRQEYLVFTGLWFASFGLWVFALVSGVQIAPLVIAAGYIWVLRQAFVPNKAVEAESPPDEAVA